MLKAYSWVSPKRACSRSASWSSARSVCSPSPPMSALSPSCSSSRRADWPERTTSRRTVTPPAFTRCVRHSGPTTPSSKPSTTGSAQAATPPSSRRIPTSRCRRAATAMDSLATRIRPSPRLGSCRRGPLPVLASAALHPHAGFMPIVKPIREALDTGGSAPGAGRGATRASTHPRFANSGLGELGVLHEFRRQRRPPDVQRVLLGEVARGPGALLGDEVEVVVVLGEAAPRVAGVVEVVRPDHVAAQAPPQLPAGVPHPGATHRDLVHRADLEGGVVEPRALGGEERDVVVVGGAAEERDDALHAVGELEPQNPGVEVELAVDVRREEEHVAELAGRRLEAPVGIAPDDLALDVPRGVDGQRRVGWRLLTTLG